MHRDFLKTEWNDPVTSMDGDWAQQCSASFLAVYKIIDEEQPDEWARNEISTSLSLLNCEPKTVNEINLVWRRWLATVWKIMERWYRRRDAGP